MENDDATTIGKFLNFLFTGETPDLLEDIVFST